jgi:bifunctional non-homologous end joining protein LigD
MSKIPQIQPMLATLADKAFDSSDYIFEIKWDGYRALGKVEKKKVALYSRNLKSFNEDYPTIVKSLEKVKESLLFDGEIIAYDSKGTPSFQALQNLGRNQDTKIEYIIFDLLFLEGKNLMDLPLIERKKLLAKILSKYPELTFSSHIEENGIKFFEEAKKKNLEGIMAKKIDGRYLPGKRSDSWLKVKTHKTDEAIIVGFTKPRNSRKYFGALVLGQYRNNDELIFVGHTGTGFSHVTLKDLYLKMKPLITSKSPFKTKIPLNAPVTWVKPVYVAELKFAEWTSGNNMRQPVFLGLRVDKKPKEAKKEKVKIVENVKK